MSVTKTNTRIIISITDFIDFLLKTGTRKQSLVRQIKKRPPYSPEFDFWKKLREGLISYHRENLSINYFDDLINSISDFKKINKYPPIIDLYKRFIRRKQIDWFEPPTVKYNIEDLHIRINPELGLLIKEKKYVIKLYFKDERLTKHEADLLLLLMKEAIDPNNELDYSYAILEVQRGKLHERNPDLSILPLLEGEALNFMRIWQKLI